MNYMRNKLLIACLLLFGSNYLAFCQPTDKINRSSVVAKQNRVLGIGQRTELIFDSAEINYFIIRYPNLKPLETNIKSFYSKRHYVFAWFNKSGLVEQAAIWSNKLSNSESDGVYKTFFYQAKLDSLIDEQKVKSKGIGTNIDLELLLSCLYFEYSNTVWTGMDDAASRSANWLIPRKDITYEEYLDSILHTPINEPSPREPVYRQYELLKVQLKKYHLLQATSAWRPIVSPKKANKLGDTSTFILQIKRRLFKLGDFEGDTLNNLFDGNLVEAINRFQIRNGLNSSGSLSAQTLSELNVPIQNKIKQIVVNMERSRWLPLHVSGDHVAVNIPEFKLHVYHADSLLWSCNAVVGQTIHPTTQFYGEIKYVVFSPYWNIPPGILRNEILPALKKNPNYLLSHNMEINGYNKGVPIIRQKPGKSNALGLVKFLFPNSYNIYLHDTPAKSLFTESSRAFSHGCIRISEPQKLAGYLLRDRADWDLNKIGRAMQGGKERQVTLSKTIPVFIAYFTAFVDRDNRLNFRKDIYNLDNRLSEMIMSGDDY
jgi:murein L,D-transpeptidase YcbB/YkuD